MFLTTDQGSVDWTHFTACIRVRDHAGPDFIVLLTGKRIFVPTTKIGVAYFTGKQENSE